jgi:protein-disulfide isomerase
MKPYLPFIIIAIVLGIAAGVGYTLYQSEKQPITSNVTNSPTNTTSSPSASTNSQTSTPTDITSSKYNSAPPGAAPPNIEGNPGAPVTIEEFGDYQCPPCKETHPALKKVLAFYGHKVRLIFRNLPLVAMHKHALAAAYAAEAAGLQGRFWEMHHKLYDQQNAWKELDDTKIQEVFVNYARDLKLDVDQFKRDMLSQRVASRVHLDRERADALGVDSTPTIFVNGKLIPFKQYQNLNPVIEAALKEKGQ